MAVYEGTEKYIFVSYAHKDSESVIPIINALNAAGFRVWYDQGIAAGSEWPAYIEEHLKNCSRVLVFMSPYTVASENCRNEINYASFLKKEMLIVYLKETELAHGLALQLNSKQSLFRNRHSSDESFMSEMLKAKILQCCREGGEDNDDSIVSDIKIPGTTTVDDSAPKRPLTDLEETIKEHQFGGPAISRIGVICSNTPSVAWPQGNYTQVVNVDRFSAIHFHCTLIRVATTAEEKTVGVRVFDENGSMVFENISKMMFYSGNNRFSTGWVIKESHGCTQPADNYTVVIWLDDSRAFEYSFVIVSSAPTPTVNTPVNNAQSQVEIERLERNLRQIGLFIYHIACWIVYLICLGMISDDNIGGFIFFGIGALIMTIFHCRWVLKSVTKKRGLAFLFSFIVNFYFGFYLLVFFIIALVKCKEWKARIAELKRY